MKSKTVKDDNKKSSKRYTLGEEIANSVTHGIGILFSVVTLTILLVYSIWEKNSISIISFSIYGLCSISLYVASTLYHSFQNEGIKKILRVFDHSSIYLFIAGTYTPIILLSMKGYWRIGMLVAIWTIAIAGIIFKIITYNKFDKYNKVSTILYILMGWLVILAIKPMIEMMPFGLLMWLIAGGVVYTVGTIFYGLKRMPYNHATWHLFVLGGSVLHFIGIFLYLK